MQVVPGSVLVTFEVFPPQGQSTFDSAVLNAIVTTINSGKLQLDPSLGSFEVSSVLEPQNQPSTSTSIDAGVVIASAIGASAGLSCLGVAFCIYRRRMAYTVTQHPNQTDNDVRDGDVRDEDDEAHLDDEIVHGLPEP